MFEARLTERSWTMARKTRTLRKQKVQKITPARAVVIARDSARKAVDAGLEAASTARQSALGAFDALVKKGAALEAASRKAALARVRKTRQAAIAQARKARKVALEQASAARTRTAEAVTHLEHVFEQRVSRAISKLGVPTSKDVRSLSRQVAQLQASVESLRRTRARAAH
jgi:poly(hydroxyalkanoate) granule-associated protein